MFRGLVYLTGLATLIVIGLIAAVAFRVDKWPWEEYAESGRQYIVDRLEETTFQPGANPADEPGRTGGPRSRVEEPRHQEYVRPESAPLAIRHTVRRGDTLYRIARQYYGDAELWPRIAQANDIRRPSDLRVGHVLLIPVTARRQSAAPARYEPRLAIMPALDGSDIPEEDQP